MGEDTSASSRSIVEEISPALFETIPEALVIVDSSGRIVAVNSGAEQLLGYDRGELVGQPVETLVPNSFREGHPAHRMRYAAQATTRRMGEVMGLQAARKDGSLVAVDITLSTIPSSSGSLIVCAVRDATERAAITQALQASESRFRTLAEQATDGIFISDTSGRYLAVNDAGCTMLGYRRDQLLRLSITDLIDERESDRLPEEIARLAGGTPVKSEWRFRRCDGTTFEGEVNARKLPDSRFLAVLRDVTERKQQEDEQRRTRRFIEAVAKASPSWIYVFDLDDLSLRYLNRSILRDLGYPPEAEGLTRLADFRSFIPSEDNERLTQLVEAWHALGDDDVRSSEYRIRDASGAIRWCLGRETVFARHPDGRVHQILGTMTEVTPLKLAIERLQESEERFRTLIQDLDVGVLLQDAADDRILLSNQAADEMLGMTPELDRPSSHTWPWRLLREDGTDYPRDQLPSVVAARTGQPVWNRIVGSFNVESGICRWLQVTAMPRHQTPDRVRHVLVTLTDVTARKVAEDALIAARMEWEHSFNALTDWVCVLDGEGRVLRANRAMRERFETRPGSLVGMHPPRGVSGGGIGVRGGPVRFRPRRRTSGRVHDDARPGARVFRHLVLPVDRDRRRGARRSRHHEAAPAGGAAAPIAEDAGDRSVGGWRRARLQQPAHRHQQLHAAGAHRSAAGGRQRARGHRRHSRRGRSRRAAHAPAAALRAQGGVGGARRQPERAPAAGRADAQAPHRRGCGRRDDAGAEPVGDAGRPRSAGADRAQPRPQCAGCDA
jgi:PAS domain S-box-containing protein